MWPLVLLPCGDGVRPLLLPLAAALPSLSVTEQSSSGLTSSSVAGMGRGQVEAAGAALQPRARGSRSTPCEGTHKRPLCPREGRQQWAPSLRGK